MAQPDPSNHRDRRKLETRRRVLEAARALFGRHGYDAVTIRMIADAAGVSVGSVFTTLPSKSAVLDAIVMDAAIVQEPLIDAALAQASGVVARLRAIFVALYAGSDERLALLLQVIANSWIRPPEAEAEVRAALEPLLERIVIELRRARAEGEIDAAADLRLIADTFYAVYIANYRRAAYDAWTVEDLCEHMERHILLVLRGAGLRD